MQYLSSYYSRIIVLSFIFFTRFCSDFITVYVRSLCKCILSGLNCFVICIHVLYIVALLLHVRIHQSIYKRITIITSFPLSIHPEFRIHMHYTIYCVSNRWMSIGMMWDPGKLRDHDHTSYRLRPQTTIANEYSKENRFQSIFYMV